MESAKQVEVTIVISMTEQEAEDCADLLQDPNNFNDLNTEKQNDLRVSMFNAISTALNDDRSV